MERAAGGIFAILFFSAVGLGIYAYTQHSGRVTAQTQLAAIQQKLAAAETASQDSKRSLDQNKNELSACQTQLDGANKRAEEAEAKATANTRRRR